MIATKPGVLVIATWLLTACGSNDVGQAGGDGSVVDATSITDGAGPRDAGTDASDGAADAADGDIHDAGCMPPTGPMTDCPGAGPCNYATMLAHVPPCDGGTQSCATYADGGELWILWSGCH